jgi:lipopolysaccharide export system protein LptA
MKLRRFLFLIIINVLSSLSLWAQVTDSIAVKSPQPQSEKKAERIIIQNANRQIIEVAGDTLVQKLYGDVRAYHNGAFIFCDTAILKENDLLAFGNVVIIQDDTIKMFSDTLEYYGDISRAYLRHQVVLQSNKTTLFTPELEYFLDEKIAFYHKKGLIQDSVRIMKSQFGKYDLQNKYIDFDEKVSIDGEDFLLRTQSLRFYTEEEVAVWNVPALIRNKNSWLYSETGFYNMKNKFSQFSGNAQYIDEESSAQAEIIHYDQESGQIEMYVDVFYVSGTDMACGDTIFHNRKTEISEILGNAFFEGETQHAQGKKIFYNKSEDAMKISGGGTVQDSSITITALYLDYNSRDKKGLAFGDVILHDTSANMTIWCDSLNYSGEEEYFKAINWNGKPVLSYQLDEDTLFISADTLFSIREIRWVSPEDTTQMIENDGLIALDSLQEKNVMAKSDAKESRAESKSDKNSGSREKLKSSGDEDTPKPNEAQGLQELTKESEGENKTGEHMITQADPLGTEAEISKSNAESVHESSQKSFPAKDTLLSTNQDIAEDSILSMKMNSDKFIELSNDTSSVQILDSTMLLVNDSIKDFTIDTLEHLIPDTIKYLIADKNVKIYRKGMQMISDSLSYHSRDSIFSFFVDPVIWSDSTQITGDTIHLFLKNKKLERLNVPSIPLIVKTGDEEFFDQITGKILDADFSDGKLSKMKIQNNAQSVYYMLDSDKAYMGVNTTECKFMIYEFEAGEISDIRNYTDVAGTIHPMEDTNHDQLKLSGFVWKIDQKPNLEEVLNKYYELIIPAELRTDKAELSIESLSEDEEAQDEEANETDTDGSSKENMPDEETIEDVQKQIGELIIEESKGKKSKIVNQD